MGKREPLDPWVTWTDKGLEVLDKIIGKSLGEELDNEDRAQLIILLDQVTREQERRKKEGVALRSTEEDLRKRGWIS